MSYKKIVNATKISSDMIDSYVGEGQTVLDCTVGNGNDLIQLARRVGDTGKVYGFDIQKIALDNTLEKLACESLVNRVQLIRDGHENIDLHIKEKLDFIIYNLGYLPKGDKSIITKRETTITSIKKALKLLNDNGLMLITCYIGHDGGKEEQMGIEELLLDLDQKIFNVIKFEFINQRNYPPVVYGVEKTRIRR